MTTVSSENLISSEVYVVSKSSSGWIVEDKRAKVIDVMTSTKENCRMVMIQNDNEARMVKDSYVFTKKESALKEVEFLNNDEFESVIEFSKDYDWKQKKGSSYKNDTIYKNFKEVEISISRKGTILMNLEIFKTNASTAYIKDFIKLVK